MAENNQINKSSSELMKTAFNELRAYVHRVISCVEMGDDDLARLKSIEQKGISIVSSHRSHLDYLISGVQLIDESVPRVRFAAGDNLTTLPILGRKFKSLGAFSVYRGKASQRSYLFKLADFVKKVLLRGQNLLVYPEGGRSYSGRMLEMKTGLIGAAVMAQKENPNKEYYYLPLTCSYSIVPDARFFPILLKGKQLRDKSKNPLVKMIGSGLYLGSDILTFLKIWLFPLKKSTVYVDIGEHIKIRDVVDIDGTYREKSKNQFFANGVAIKKSAEVIYDAILKTYRIMPHHIVAYLLLKEQFHSESREEFVDSILREVKENGFNRKSLDGKSIAQIMDEGFDLLKRNGVCRGSLRKPHIKSEMLLDYFAGSVKDLRKEPA